MSRGLSLCVHGLDSPFRVGGWYFTRALSRCVEQVDYVPAPVSPWHLAKVTDPAVRARFRNILGRLKGRERVFGDHIVQRDVCTLLPAGPGFPFATRTAFQYAYQLSFPRLPCRHYDAVYCDNPYLVSVLRHVSWERLVVRVPDIFAGGAHGYGGALQESLAWLLERADLVVVASETVRDELRAVYGCDALIIGNGVELSRFSAPREEPAAYAGVRNRAVYVGAFDYWVDGALLRELAQSQPELDVFLIGNASSRWRSQLSAPNIHFLGPRAPGEVTGYLQHAHVGLIPFDTVNHRRFVDGINPLKAYEYLAAGLPVVSTDFRGVRNISEWVACTDTVASFCDAVAAFLDDPRDRNAVRQAAQPYDWDILLQPFADYVAAAVERRE